MNTTKRTQSLSSKVAKEYDWNTLPEGFEFYWSPHTHQWKIAKIDKGKKTKRGQAQMTPGQFAMRHCNRRARALMERVMFAEGFSIRTLLGDKLVFPTFSAEISAIRAFSPSGKAQGLFSAGIDEGTKKFFAEQIDKLSAPKVNVDFGVFSEIAKELKEGDRASFWQHFAKEVMFAFAHLINGGLTAVNCITTFLHFVSNIGFESLTTTLADYFCKLFSVVKEKISVLSNFVGSKSYTGEEYLRSPLADQYIQTGQVQGFEFATDSVARGFIGSVAIILSTALLGFLPPGKYIDAFINRFSKLSGLVKSGELVMTHVESAIKMVLEYLGVTCFPKALDKETAFATANTFNAEVAELANSDLEQRLRVDLQLKTQVDSLIKRGFGLLRMYDSLGVSHTERQALSFSLMFLTSARAAASNATIGTGQMRVPPYLLHMYGDTGAGKTTATHFLIARVMKHLGSKNVADLNNLVYWHYPGMKHWDGYKPGTKVTVMDDFGVMKDSAAHPNTDFSDTIRMMNSATYTLPMASLSEKGTTFFESNLVIWSSNRQNFKPDSMTNPEAFTRRVNTKYRVTVRNDCAMTRKINGMDVKLVDPSKLKKGETIVNGWLFQEETIEGGSPIGDVIPFEEFAKRICIAMSARAKHDQNVLDSIADYFHSLPEEPITTAADVVDVGPDTPPNPDGPINLYDETPGPSGSTQGKYLDGVRAISGWKRYAAGVLLTPAILCEEFLGYAPQEDETAANAGRTYRNTRQTHVPQEEEGYKHVDLRGVESYYDGEHLDSETEFSISQILFNFFNGAEEYEYDENVEFFNAKCVHVQERLAPYVKDAYAYAITRTTRLISRLNYAASQKKFHSIFNSFFLTYLQMSGQVSLPQFTRRAVERDEPETREDVFRLMKMEVAVCNQKDHAKWKHAFQRGLTTFGMMFREIVPWEKMFVFMGSMFMINMIALCVSYIFRKFFPEKKNPAEGAYAEKGSKHGKRSNTESFYSNSQMKSKGKTNVEAAYSPQEAQTKSRTNVEAAYSPEQSKAKTKTNVEAAYTEQQVQVRKHTNVEGENPPLVPRAQAECNRPVSLSREDWCHDHQIFTDPEIMGFDNRKPVYFPEKFNLETLEALVEEYRAKQPCKCKTGSAESAFDTNTEEIIRLVHNNGYRIEGLKAGGDNEWIQMGSANVLCGRIVMTNAHIMKAPCYYYRLVSMTLKEGVEFTADDIQVYEPTGVHAKKDIALFEMPRHFPCGKNIIPYFMNRSDQSNFKTLPVVHVVGQHAHGISNKTAKDAIAFDTDFTVYSEGASFERTIRGFYEYDIPTVVGDCGSLVFCSDKQRPKKIVGIHMAGHDQRGGGVGCAVTQELLHETISQMKLRYPESVYGGIPTGTAQGLGFKTEIHDEITYYIPDEPFGDVSTFACGTMKESVNQATRTNIHPSPLYGKIQEPTMAPAALRPFQDESGKYIQPMKLAQQKVFTPLVGADETLLKAAANHYKAKLFKNLPSKDHPMSRVLTWEEGIKGVENEEFLQPLNRSSSPGYGWKKTKGKRAYLGEDEYITDNPEVLAKRDEMMETLKSGKRVFCIWTDTLKDERRTLEKVKAGKTRLFSAGEMVFTIIFRQYFQGFAAHMMNNCRRVESCVGINAFSLDWHLLAMDLQKHGPHVIAGDFSNYDGTLNASVLWCCLDVILAYYDLYGQTDEERKIRTLLWFEIVNSVHVNRSTLYMWTHSQPSGNPLTAILNSLYHSIVARVVFMICARDFNDDKAPLNTLRTFESVVVHRNYGDDDCWNISPSIIDWFNQETITEAFTHLGMVYTDEAKTGNIVKYRTLDEINFLKRAFRYEPEVARYVGPLSLSTVLEMAQWVRGTVDVQDLTAETLEEASRELALHDIPTWNKWCPVLTECSYELKSIAAIQDRATVFEWLKTM